MSQVDQPLIAKLSASEKLDLLRKMLERRTQSSRSYPLSHGQQALRFLHDLTPESSAYNVALAARLETAIPAAQLRTALQALTDRHDVLRTTIASGDDEQPPRQVVHARWDVSLTEFDATGCTPAELTARVSAEARRPFDLEHGPLLRVGLFHTDDSSGDSSSGGNTVLLFAVHHIIGDFWSLVLLASELGELLSGRSPAELPSLPATYEDYVREQQELLASPRGRDLEEFWHKRLSGELPVLELPLDHARPSRPSDAGAAHSFEIPLELAIAVRETAKASGVTLNALLLSAFQLLLHRLSGQQELLVGTPCAGRSRRDFEQVVGYFVNMIVLRSQTEPELTAAEFIQRTSRELLSGLEHQDYPFPLLVQSLAPQRDPGRSPLFQALFVLQKSHLRGSSGTGSLLLGRSDQALQLAGLRMTPLPLEPVATPFDLNLVMDDAAPALSACFQYNRDLFDGATMARWGEHFCALLEQLTAKPEHPLRSLSLLTEKQRTSILENAKGNLLDQPAPATVVQAFREQAARHPDRLAVSLGSESLTYQELDERSDHVAQTLRQRGVDKDTPVAILWHRTPATLVALWGVLKAGGAYVPLDPAYPPQRLQHMLVDSGSQLMLVDEENSAEFPTLPGFFADVHVERLPIAGAEAHGESISLDWPEPQATDLAYVLYTSGSTGEPKGVMIPHAALANHMQWMLSEFPLDPTAKVLQRTPASFDASVWELMAPPLAGAELVLAAGDAYRDPQLLAATIRQQRITTLQVVPSLLGMLLKESGFADCTSLERVFCGGEALPADLVREFYRQLPHAQLVNLYGPTECTIDATWYACPRSFAASTVPIGRPIANLEALVLDGDRQIAPVGVTGELYLSGVGLARGYWNKPQLTAERFLPHPLDPHERVYRTGDLVRWNAAGQLEYLGRADHQVKLRGFRIELGEIEAALQQHNAVQRAAVLCREDRPGDRRLVAYVVSDEANDEQLWADLPEHLRARLPEYMVPTAWVRLAELPLTPNGKLDRHKLPAPEGNSAASQQAYTAPRTTTEQLLCEIWQEVLHVERVGIHDNFFHLGGHSLLATQVMARVRRRLEVEVPLRELFGEPTVARLAEVIDRELGVSPADRALATITAHDWPAEKLRPLSAAQRRLWFLEQLDPGSPLYNVPAAVRLRGPLDAERLQQALDVVAARHELLRSRLVEENDSAAWQVADSGPQIEIVDMSELRAPAQEHEVELAATAAAQRGFDLQQDLLARVTLLRLNAAEHVCLLTMNHLICDGWSLGVLLQELAASYQAIGSGHAPAFAPLAWNYADYALWQEEQQGSPEWQKQLDWWAEQLAGAPPLELPTDRPRPAVQSFPGEHLPVEIPAKLTTQLQSLSQSHGVTLYMTLLAAFETLLHRYTGQADLCVGTPVAGRRDTAWESPVGLFVNSLTLRADLSGNPTFAELLERVKGTTLAAFEHQDVPFEQVVDRLGLRRDLSRTPLFQTMFVLQNAPLEGWNWGELELEPLEFENGTSKFDLTLSLSPSGDGLRGWWEFNTDLFDVATAEQMLRHFVRLLEAVATDASQPIGRLPLLDEAERRAHLDRFTGNPTEHVPPYATLHEWFAAQAAATPHNIAVKCGEEELTYAELNVQANRLAWQLQQLGVGPDVLVGLCLERSPAMLVGVLGILKAGGAYVPLDPSYPAARREFLLADMQAEVLVTDVANQGLFENFAGTMLVVEEATAAGDPRFDQNPACHASAANLAYVIYTSGSTGQPKGVQVEHRQVTRLMSATQPWFNFSAADVWTLFHSVAFDFSVWEIWGPLLYGGRLVVVPYYVSRSPEEFYQLLLDEEVTVLNQTPSAFRQLMQVDRAADASQRNRLRLRWVIFGGEMLDVAWLQSWFDWHGDRQPRLVNMYGITETTVHVTFREVTQADLQLPVRSPIGVPIPDLELLLLDAYGQLVPTGVPGEIHVAGPGVARGYLRREELTRERFAELTFDGKPRRFYKSGDLARFRRSGELEFLGRADQQVKLRGFRIELGEIEALLQADDAVQTAVVQLLGEGDQARLVAYVVPTQPDEFAAAELRTRLAQQLPAHMVPDAIVPLTALPLTANGKLDRRQLPAPEVHYAQASTEHAAPVTPTEQKLLAIWQEVLRHDQFGIHEEFFAVGGNSLLAAQAISRARREFEREIPLRQLFERPTIARLAEAIDSEVHVHGLAAIRRREPNEPWVLTSAQQRLWFLDQLEPGSPLYNIPAAVRISGPLQVSVLKESLAALFARHAALRMSVHEVDGTATVDFYDHQLMLEVRKVPASKWPETMRDLAQQPFDLAHDPLLRATLLSDSEDGHALVLVVHHLVADGWSLGVLLEELQELYQAAMEGREVRLPEPAIDFSDYAAWQQAQLASEEHTAGLKYWAEQLSGAAVLELPTDQPRAATPGTAGRQFAFELSPELTTTLEQLATGQGTTLFAVLAAGLQTLLQRYTGQTDISLGTPVAGRDHAELEPLVGLLVNTVVLRGDLSGDPTFADLLARTHETALAAWQHQHVPFDAVVQRLAVERDLARSPLFQVLLVLQNAPLPTMQLGNLSMEPLEVDSGTAKFDLSWAFVPDGKKLRGWIEYRTDLFAEETIARLATHFQQLLAAAAEHPQAALHDLPLLNESEQQQLTEDWQGPRVSYPRGILLHEMFEQQAAKTPDAIALVCESESWTYRELDRQANFLAAQLSGCGVGPDTLVGICAERSREMVVGLLGILKAGGAYVPLDPDYPPRHLQFVLADTAAPVVLCQRKFASQLAEVADCQVLLLEEAARADVPEVELPAVPLREDHLAYVIYTSGSTGRPKGVMITHQGICNRLFWMQAEYQLTAADRVLQKTPYSFDVSVWEFFWPLATGAPLVMARPHGHKDLSYLTRLIRAEQVTTLHFVPSMLQVFLEDPDAAACASLRTVIASGEALPPESVKRFYQVLPQARLHNLYGPTEASVDVTYWPCPADFRGGVVPIGRPIANMQAVVLDEHRQLVPPGVTGELYLGGVGLARGYWNREELTAEHFLSSPLVPTGRLYRTGDLARWNSSGEIEYLGRADHQVKLRGFRIELGEIEAVLGQHPAVQSCAVLCREDRPGDRRLVAYVVADTAITGDDETQLWSDLQEHLRARLPEYMVPAAWMKLAELPLSANGKLDRKQLPAPDANYTLEQTEYAPPRTPTEEMLCEIWQEVLKLERVGIHDNFFHLGGHSLLATQVMARLRRRLEVEVPLRELFNEPTIARLAELIDREQPATAKLPRITAHDWPDEKPRPLSAAQRRLWFLEQLSPGSPLYNVAGAVRLQGPLDATRLQQALDAVAARHELLRSRIVNSGESAAWQVSPAGPTFEVVELGNFEHEQQEEEVTHRALAEAQQGFDLRHDLLVRVKLLRLSAAEHVCLLTLHHLICDGWSLGVLLQELAAAYDALGSGQTPSLPPLAWNYADYALWQQEQQGSPEWEAQLSYWADRLTDAPALELPTDRPRPAVQSFRGQRLPVEIPAELAEQLQDLSRRQGVTLYMTLLAAFETLLHRYSGQTDICVGTPVAGRRDTAWESPVGLFVNSLTLRADLSGSPTFRELLSRVKSTTLAAFEHQDVPFEQVVDRLGLRRDVSRTPLFQTMFVLQNAPLGSWAWQDLQLEPLEFETGTAKFDLTLSLSPTEAGLRGTWEFNTDLFDVATAEQMLRHYVRLLKAIAAAPDQAIGELPLLDETELAEQLVEFQPDAAEVPPFETLPDWFAAQAAQTPNSLAVRCGNEELTYAQLNEQANCVAWRLQELGVGPDCLVALCLERSLSLVGVLGILQAGGAYVPLDPAYPAARRDFVLEDTDAKFLVTDAASQRLFADFAGHTLVVEEAIAGGSQCDKNPTCSARGEHLAYVIYTSGSTGQPKGVQIEHRQLTQMVHWAGELYGDDLAGMLFSGSICFDLSVLQMFPTLCHGGYLELVENGFALADLADTTRLRMISEVPMVLAAMLDQAPLPPSVRTVNCGADLVSPDLVAKVFANSAVEQMFDMYGPTEATVLSTIGPRTANGPATIGTPLPYARIYVLDGYGNLLPRGAIGEICIGGEGVGRGYWQREALTAQHFVPDPFADRDARMYRTGDRGRWLPDGRLQFCGRIDQQVKIRGYRIEPGEIEAVLAAHPGVREVAIVAQRDQANHRRLVAYWCARPEQTTDENTLRRWLAGRLPDYMVPVAWVQLEQLPLTNSGKIDRAALPEPGVQDNVAGSAEFVPPQTEQERELCVIWERVLGLEQVGIHHNFFELGGDSILSIQIVSQAATAGLKLSPLDLFQHQTVAELATVARSGRRSTAPQEELVGPVPLGPVQEWWLAQQPQRPEHFNQSLLLEVYEPLDTEALEQATASILAHHDALRIRLERTPSGWLQRYTAIDEQPRDAFRMVSLADTSPEQQRVEIEAEAQRVQRSLDLASGPVMRVVYFDLGPQRNHRLLVVVHHLVVDGVSWRILLEDLYTAYSQQVSSGRIWLPPKTSSLAQWGEAITNLASSPELLEEVPYWRAQFAEASEALPHDFSTAEEATVASTAEVTRVWSAAQTERLLHELPAALQTEINDVLVAALAQAVREAFGANRWWLDLERHGRDPLPGAGDELDLSRTVGWFTSLVPVLVDLPAAAPPRDRLLAARALLQAIPHQGRGLGVLRYLADDDVREQLNNAPQPQLLLNYLGQLDHVLGAGQTHFGPAPEHAGDDREPDSLRAHEFEVNAYISGGQLHLRWGYSQKLHRQETIERAVDAFLAALAEFLEVSGSAERTSPRASAEEFTETSLDAGELSDLLDRLNGEG